jgi:Mg2+/citrate symporter
MQTEFDPISSLFGEAWLILNGERPVSPILALTVVAVTTALLVAMWQGHREKRLKAEAAARARREAIEDAISKIVTQQDPAFSPFNVVVPLLVMLIGGYLFITLLSAIGGG